MSPNLSPRKVRSTGLRLSSVNCGNIPNITKKIEILEIGFWIELSCPRERVGSVPQTCKCRDFWLHPLGRIGEWTISPLSAVKDVMNGTFDSGGVGGLYNTMQMSYDTVASARSEDTSHVGYTEYRAVERCIEYDVCIEQKTL